MLSHDLYSPMLTTAFKSLPTSLGEMKFRIVDQMDGRLKPQGTIHVLEPSDGQLPIMLYIPQPTEM